MDTKVLIGVATGEYSRRADFYDYIHMLEKPANSMMLFCHDRTPASSRNAIFEQALEHNCTHVLLIDDDMTFPSDALIRMLAHDKDIVSGLYLGRAYPHQPIIFTELDETGHAFFIYMEDELPELLPIEAAGFGFVLIKTNVIKKMERPWVRLGEIDNTQWCDDIGFFFRAKPLGVKSFCDTTIRCGHIGTVVIVPQYDEKKRKWYTGYDTCGKGMVTTPQIPPLVPEHISEDKAV